MGQRELMHDAVAEAREVVGSVVRDLRSENTFSNDELLTRYEQQHRGRPFALLDFAAGQAGGGDAMTEALRYEQQMEQLLTQQGGM